MIFILTDNINIFVKYGITVAKKKTKKKKKKKQVAIMIDSA